jgi:methyl coenzyme M reductase subunit C-like uncharacterized protein (methanogenesis marker protein 7)
VKLVEISLEELRELISEIVEAKLQNLIADPDEGLELRDEIKEQLREAKRLLDSGELLADTAKTGMTLEEVIDMFGSKVK